MKVVSFYRLFDCSFYIWAFDHYFNPLLFLCTIFSRTVWSLHFHSPILKDLAGESSKKTSQFIEALQCLRVNADGSQVFMYLEVMQCTESYMSPAFLLEQTSVLGLNAETYQNFKLLENVYVSLCRVIYIEDKSFTPSSDNYHCKSSCLMPIKGLKLIKMSKKKKKRKNHPVKQLMICKSLTVVVLFSVTSSYLNKGSDVYITNTLCLKPAIFCVSSTATQIFFAL